MHWASLKAFKNQKSPGRAYLLFLSWPSTSCALACGSYRLLGLAKSQDKNYQLFQLSGPEPNQHLSWVLKLQMVYPMTSCTMASAAFTNTQKPLVIYVLLIPFLQETQIKKT